MSDQGASRQSGFCRESGALTNMDYPCRKLEFYSRHQHPVAHNVL